MVYVSRDTIGIIVISLNLVSAETVVARKDALRH